MLGAPGAENPKANVPVDETRLSSRLSLTVWDALMVSDVCVVNTQAVNTNRHK